MTRLAALGALALALSAPTAVPAAAAAGPAPEPAAKVAVGLGITSNALDVVMTNDGAAHVAYLTRSGALVYTLHVCRIPAGGTTCTATADKVLPNDDDTTGPWIVSDGTNVTAAVGNSDGAAERTYATRSTNGTTYGTLSQVAAITARDVELSPAGDRLWIAAATGPSAPSNVNEYLAFTSAPLPGSATSSAAVFSATPGSRTVGGQLLGVAPDGKPVAFVAGNTPDFATGSYFRAFSGTPTDANLHNAAAWGGLSKYDLPAPAQRNGGYDVASGNGRMWLGYEGLQRDTVLRPFAGGGLGAPVSPDCVSSRFSAGTQDAPDVAVSRTGDLLVTETGSNGSGMFLGFFHGTPDGSRFSPYTELAAAPGIRDVETAADPTSDAGGVAVWTADAIYGGQVSFARMPAVAPAACPAPGGGGGDSSTVTGQIGGATVALSVPDACVPTAKKYKVKVAKKKGKGTVRQVVFKATGAKKKVDAKAPFKAKLKVKKGTPSGTRITVKAKITVESPKGKLATKKLKSSFLVC